RRTPRRGSRRTTSRTSTACSTPSTARSTSEETPIAEFKLPDVGEGLTEAEIVTWKVEEGDTLGINDILVEIETAKSLVELPSPFAGVVEKLMLRGGETVPVGTPIIAIGDTASRSVEPVETAEQTES